MAQLVILGHKTRSKEVIEILEMLDGKVSTKLSGGASSIGYYINSIGNIDFKHYSYFDDAIQFTLEEFLEKFPYKVGDKVYNVVQNENQTITNLIWDPQENEIVYQTNYNEYVYVNYLQPYKEETKEKINVAKLLEGCPRGMELNCVMYEDCRFLNIDTEGNSYLIRITTPCGVKHLDKYGCYTTDDKAKCIIFPKGKMTWEGFVPFYKFKDGDVVAHQNHMGTWIGIFHKHDYLNESFSSYCCIGRDGKFWANSNNGHGYDKTLLATEEEKEKLFKAIKDNGYKWNPETKELEKLIQPKFKVGDWITDGATKCQIHSIDDTQYWYSKSCVLGSIESVNKRYHLWTINDAKDGNVLFHSDSASNGIFIFKEILQCGTLQKVICYCDYDSEDGFCLGENHTCCWADSKILRPATEEQCRFLFRKIKEKGYKWNPYTKTLEKPIEPKFKVGDKVLWNYDTRKTNTISNVTLTENRGYVYWIDTEGCSSGWWGENELTPIPNKFNISTLIPFESRVLARYCKDSKWIPTFWGSYDKEDPENPYNCCGMLFAQCIPYEGNEYLLNTADDCDEYFKTWQ